MVYYNINNFEILLVHELSFEFPCLQLQCVVMVKCIGVMSTVTSMARQRCASMDCGQICAFMDPIK